MKSLLIHKQTLRQQMVFVYDLVKAGIERGDVLIELKRPRRSLSQNSKLWPMLVDVSKQVNWYGERLTPEDWKDIFSAALRKQRAVPGIDGGFVVLGLRTSKLGIEEFSDLIEIIYAFGSERSVKWSESDQRVNEE